MVAGDSCAAGGDGCLPLVAALITACHQSMDNLMFVNCSHKDGITSDSDVKEKDCLKRLCSAQMSSIILYIHAKYNLALCGYNYQGKG